MKKITNSKVGIILVLFTLSINKLSAQSTSCLGGVLAPGANQPTATPVVDFLGWTSGINVPLRIKNEDNP